MSVILVVDDTPANIRLMEAVLGAHDYTVRSATSGAAALAAVGSPGGPDAPDLVLLDVRMPGLDGFEVCRRIRLNPASSALPVIMVTASGNEERVAALEAGADDFVVRPFDQAELLARVKSLLRIKHYQDTIVEQAADLAAWNRVLEEQVAEQVDEVQRLQRLRRFLAPQIADAVLSSPDQALLEPHRAEVAVLCVDVRGFTSFASSAEPEEVVAALQAYHEVVGEIVRRHGATVGTFTAESLMMFFNDPLPCVDPALRAARAAAELRDASSGFAARWRPLGWDLTVGSSVSYGYATLGVLGFDGRLDYTAVGPMINTAAALAVRAGDGEVLLTPRARAEVADRLDAAQPQGQGRRAAESRTTESRTTESRTAERPGRPTPSGSPGHRVELRVLGPIELVIDGTPVALPGVKLRRLLGLLVLHRRQVVSVDRLADALWDASPPAGTTATLRVYVSRLRKLLAAAGEEGMLQTHPSSYELDIADDAVDVSRFQSLVAAGRAAVAADQLDEGCDRLSRALELWRGTAYSELAAGSHVSAEALRLEESRHEVAEEYMDVQLRRGNHRQLLGELQSMVTIYPLRERLWGQLMTALYRSGRPADALAAYQSYRSRLADELGLDPSQELSQLHTAMLNRAAELDAR